MPYLTMEIPLPEVVVKLTQVKTQEALIKSGPRHIIKPDSCYAVSFVWKQTSRWHNHTLLTP